MFLQELPNPEYDAQEVQLPFGGSALHDEAGEPEAGRGLALTAGGATHGGGQAEPHADVS